MFSAFSASFAEDADLDHFIVKAKNGVVFMVHRSPTSETTSLALLTGYAYCDRYVYSCKDVVLEREAVTVDANREGRSFLNPEAIREKAVPLRACSIMTRVSEEKGLGGVLRKLNLFEVPDQVGVTYVDCTATVKLTGQIAVTGSTPPKTSAIQQTTGPKPKTRKEAEARYNELQTRVLAANHCDVLVPWYTCPGPP
jgi:hypothetical protein